LLQLGSTITFVIKKEGGEVFEIIFTTAMVCAAGWSTINKNFSVSDKEKLEKVFFRKKIYVEEMGRNREIKKRLPVLQRKTKKDHYVEYVYRIPLGLSFKEIESKKEIFEDAVNNKSVFDSVTIKNLRKIKQLNLKKDIKRQIIKLFLEQRHVKKSIQMEYDGMLRIKVFQQELDSSIPFKEEYLKSCKGYRIPLGFDFESRKMIIHDFDKYQQMIVAGMTRYGKSVFLKNLVTTLAVNNEDNISFYLIDLKGGLTFSRYEHLHCVKALADSPESAYEVLSKVHKEMRNRMQEFRKKGFENVKESGGKERVFIIIDEVGELSSDKAGKEEKEKLKACEKYMSEFSRLGAGLGYYQILTTQYPTGDIIDRQSKANSSAVLTFPLKTEVQSRVVLDESGAEKLPLIPGRAIYWTDRKRIVQTLYITNEQIRNYIEPLKKKGGEQREHVAQEEQTSRKHPLIIR
jgi:S-DNA-T family DNA segregation ATPase FtsK/SpoIIIE